MAFPTSPTTQSAQLVRQKAYASVYANATTTAPNSPLNFYVFKDLFLHLAMNKGNPDLRYVNIDGTAVSSDGGNADSVLVDGPCTLYAVFLRKIGATESIVKISNNATTAATDGTQDLAFAQTVAGTETILYADGRAESAGLTLTENTTRTGSVRTLKANRQDGFIIVTA